MECLYKSPNKYNQQLSTVVELRMTREEFTVLCKAIKCADMHPSAHPDHAQRIRDLTRQLHKFDKDVPNH